MSQSSDVFRTMTAEEAQAFVKGMREDRINATTDMIMVGSCTASGLNTIRAGLRSVARPRRRQPGA